jgi:hypothetical protein
LPSRSVGPGVAGMGPEVRSGRVAVLVDKSTQDVDAVDSPNLGQARRSRLTIRGGHAQADAPVRAAGVVMLHVLGQDTLQVVPVPNQRPVHALRPDGTHPPFGVGVRLGRAWWDLDGFDSGRGKTASNAAVNLASRSRIRNRSRLACSSRSISRLRAACAIHSPVGCVVTPGRCTRRRSSSTTNNTYNRVSPTVSTVRSHTRAGQRPARAGTPSNSGRYAVVRARGGDGAGSAAPKQRTPGCRACGTPHDPVWLE